MSSKKYFDDVAPEWERMREQFFSETVRERAYTVAGVKKGTMAADIGAGSGFITEGLLERDVKVIAVDQSKAMLEEIKKKFDSRDLECRVGDAEDLPIDSDTVDFVFANMCLHHVESPPNAIKEMTRILKPGGRLVITDLDEHNHEFLRTEQHDRWLGFTREHIRQWFVDAGLNNVAVESVGESCCSESCTEDDYASISIFVASGERE